MIELLQIGHNALFLAAAAAWFLAQVTKVVCDSVRARGFQKKFLGSSGGFPSSHTATVTALTVSAGQVYGLDTPAFAIAFFLSVIVIYDSLGVRAEVGRHAALLNTLLREHPELLPGGQETAEREAAVPESAAPRPGSRSARHAASGATDKKAGQPAAPFDERSGHSLSEVAAGLLIGILVGIGVPLLPGV